MTSTGNKFNITDYQIVNGCQTSHVLFNNRDKLTKQIWVPIKLIVTTDDDITRQIIKGTNRQTSIKEEQLRALSDYQKKLEDFYKTFDLPNRIYYERRTKQYNDVTGIEKVRIVTIPTQIRCFAAMFLNQAHRASRYYGTLMKEVGDRIFSDDHSLMGYYLAVYANFKLDSFFRNNTLDNKYRPFRYHLLMTFRAMIIGINLPQFNSREFERLCGKMKTTLWDDQKCLKIFSDGTHLIDEIVGDDLNRDRAKVQGLAEDIQEKINAN